METIEFVLRKLESMSWIVLMLMIIEWVILILTNFVEDKREGLVSIVSYIIVSIPYIFLSKVMIVATMFLLYEISIVKLGWEWYVWIICYFIYDLMVYFIHFLGHKVRLLWCIHGVHHTAEEMNLTVVARGSMFDFFLTPHNFTWLPILGFHPYMIFIIEPIARLYATYSHLSEKFAGKHPWLEKLFVTPSVHRVHHAKNYIYLDRNFGETFSIWDRIFKTFQTQVADVKIRYGILHNNLDSSNIWHIQFMLFQDLWKDIKKAPTVASKIKYVFMPPGWNHINGGKKAKAYRDGAWEKRKLKALKESDM